MAEENPHIEIKIPAKPINNSRETYFFENENQIIGNRGFVFRPYPTLKERLKEYAKERNENNFRNSSLGQSASRNLLEKNSKILNKSKTSVNIFEQPILRFKDRTDLERICDCLLEYCTPTEQDVINQVRARHVHSIDFPLGGNVKKSVFLKKIKNNKNFGYSTDNDNFKKSESGEKFNKNSEIEKKNNKIYFSRLQKLNIEAKKIRSNLHFKTHFKGVESVFIKPKQIYEIIKKEENISQKKSGNFAYNDRAEKDRIEKKNEYKNDINDLLLEEKEKQKIISTKEFTNYLNNKEYYNDRTDLYKYDNSKQDENEKINSMKKMNYLKKLAFEDNNLNQSSGNSENKKGSFSAEGGLGTENSSNDQIKNNNEKKNMNFENEHQLKIHGKIFHMRNQMGQIAKEILNKCKFYNVIKK